MITVKFPPQYPMQAPKIRIKTDIYHCNISGNGIGRTCGGGNDVLNSWQATNTLREALKDIIRGYTKEAGVRNLEREISKLARKTVKKILTEENAKNEINSKNLSDY